MIAETLFGMSEACWILTIAGILLLALAVIGTIKLVSCETARHGLAKVLTFTVVCMWMCYIAADKPARSGGDPHSPAAVLCEADSQDSQSPGEEPTRSGASTRLPDACDVGESEGFGATPIATNLMSTAIAHGSNSTYVVFSWPFGQRPVDDIVYVYAGTNLLELAKVFSVDVSGCASNALVVVEDSDFAGTNACQSAFISAGDATDTDGDGLSDSDERFVYKTDPASSDTDGDGLPDGEEIAMGSSPLAADTDGDGLGDGEELGTVSSVYGPLWLSAQSFVDVAPELATGAWRAVNWTLPNPVVLQGETVSNVTVSANGALFFNRAGHVNDGRLVCAYDFSLPIDADALVVAPFADAELFLKTNSSVLVGTGYAVGGESIIVQYNDIGRLGGGAATNSVSFQVVCQFVGQQRVLVMYRDVVGDEMDGRNAGIGFQTLRARGLRSVAYKTPGFVSDGKMLVWNLGTDTDPASSDTDGDGLTDGAEITIGTSPLYVDTDRDGLSDEWELSYGLDPLSTNGVNGAEGDLDGDGLSNLGEYLNGTDPSDTDGDTDGDGVSDVAEVQQGSDPTNASDGGIQPESAQYRDLEFNINGDYAAWEMKIEGLGPDDTRVRKISMGAPNAANTTTLKVRKGNAYRLTMRWLNCDGHDDVLGPWYCWQAKIDALPQTQSYQSYTNIRLSGNEVVAGNGWIADNADGLLTAHVDESTRDGLGNSLPGNVAGGLSATLYVLGDPVLVFDYDRDGSITDAEAEIARAGNTTFRFWVNDDNDSGDRNSSANDIPGSGPNHSDDHVNGRGDILDFTPVWIDTRAVFPSGTPQRVRNMVKWKVRSSCSKVVWSRISRLYAGVFHREDMGYGFGMGPYQQLTLANVTNVTNGAQMPDAMHDAMQLSQDCGVFLIEGSANGTDLVAEGWVGEGVNAQKAVEGAANIRISGVEDMYRHLNTRGLSDETVTWIPSVGDPVNRPDTETSSTNLVFLHGANVSQANSRAWASEVFKRMWQSGMTAKFTAVSWRSDIGTPLNYQEDASNAFFTASVLAPQLAQLPGTKVLMAHSLGNMVCSSMVQDYGLVPSSYLMCNSAVPSEAFETTRSQVCPQLIHPQWSDYHPRTWASNWHARFAEFPNDDRRKLGWPGRFSNVAQYAVNFYSTGDEALELSDDNDIDILTGVGILGGDGDVVHHCWHKQEMFKGQMGITISGSAAGTSWSGWEFQRVGDDPPLIKYDANTANGLSWAQLRTDPVFNPRPSSMMNSVIPRLVIDAHLAQGIPALMPAAGAIAFGGDAMEEVMIDVNENSEAGVLKPNGWPSHSSYPNRWCHSDMKDVAYFYNFKFYDKAVEKGNLK